jgi:IS1 family transposase
MLISDQQLIQIDEAFLRSLQARDAEAAIRLSIQLAQDLKEARERLNQNPTNSSKPSGCQAPWDKGDSEDANDQNEADDLTSVATDNTHLLSSDQSSSTDDTVDHAEAQTTCAESIDGQQEKDQRNPGKQPGAQGFGRTQTLPVTATVNHLCGHCVVCNTDLSEVEKAYTGFYTVDIEFGRTDAPGLTMTNTHHRYYAGDCPTCELHTQSEPHRAPPDQGNWQAVGMTEWRLIGPSLASMLVYMAYNLRVTRRLIQQSLDDFFGLQLCTGSINKSLRESARALAPVEEQIVQNLMMELSAHDEPESDSKVAVGQTVDSQIQTENQPDQKKILFVDETSHPEAGDLLWMWVFTTATTALFLVGHRSREIFDNLIDSCEFDGWLMTDGYQVYRHYLWRLRCWAHLLRKAQGLCESYTASVRGDGEQMLAILKQLQAAVYRAREGPEGGCQSIMPHHQATLDQLHQLCETMRDSPHEKAHALGVEFLLDWEAIFRVLEHPVWPLTNNTAEQRLRHLVMLRRIMQGTRSPQGSRALALFASVITTCRLRNASSLLYIRDVITLRRQGKEAPALPPVPKNIVMGL